MSRPVKIAFFDRDGVLNKDTGYVYEIGKFQWSLGAKEAIHLCQDYGYEVVVVTNQSGVARGYYTEQKVQALHEWMNQEIAEINAKIAAFYYCPHHPEGQITKYRQLCRCRKPEPGLILQALADFTADPADCWLIGDKESDLEAAKRAGITGYLFRGGDLSDFVSTILGG